MTIDKIYNPQNIEPEISKKWKESKVYSQHDETKKPFTILLPPPNVTGMLHIGHALDTYLQDSILRYKKLSGFDVFYVAGMDHAGIATQSKVENVLLQTQGLTKHDLGREKLVSKIWEWKEEYAAKFREQWAALGLALDYDRERFTLDKLSNIAVNKAFIELYNKGMIYRGVKAVNWDPILKTALSNIEVINKSTEQEMLYIKYPIKNSNEYLIIATVRPETMLSDVALIYNPKDERYNKLNLTVIHPLTKKELPLIADDYTDIEFGSGLMKLSAHAEIDIELIQKHNLEINETIDQDGKINFPNSQFHGLTRQEARSAIKEYLLANNLIEKIETTVSNVGYSERSNAPIEILVMPQWFVKMDSLAQKLLNHLNSEDHVEFFPKRFKETLQKWMENVHDWTISRQLWWGHQIPAWYKNGEIKVQETSPGEGWVQDEDVLDTWFSSGLAPFSFLGWPINNDLINRYYPTSLLVTGYDIIFFWVARMYFFGLELMNQKPFEHVLCHGIVRDSQGRKMSKSLNNGVDPMKVIKEYGSDALRWFLITNSTPGQDINYSDDGVKKGWAFCNKIWNIARYVQTMEDINEDNPADQWMRDKLHKLRRKIEKAMDNYETTIVGSEIEKFVLEDFSSWYIELLKVKPNKKMALKNLGKLLILLHPFLPFITDSLYKNLFNKEISQQTYASAKINCRKQSDNSEVDNLLTTISILRRYRETNGISKKETIYFNPNNILSSYQKEAILKLANAEVKENKDFLIAQDNISLYIEFSKEQKTKYLDELKAKIIFCQNEIKRASNMLNNPNFVQKAPKAKIIAEQEKLTMHQNNLLAYEKELKEQK
ncbi:valine--tRNA ligase [Mycoplasmopsis columbina]|uniref:Valine--tRNA ligase n=1 Tax=Mycoplasmopsis columbina SF7 TaxID=1037410 RepID=F9UKH5_9BACT|nr:valine--tRNA ligase [Mycoplasmopsis columbina]EGV00180.1 valyl-tRNA synthetase [Mycoplasmopsis columbina SF7]VEU77074.1 Valine--tRNA ligase [Mycoplasmopsis columbina]